MSANGHRSRKRPPLASTSWDPVATWYDGWVGDRGSGRRIPIIKFADLTLIGEIHWNKYWATTLNGKDVEVVVTGELLDHPELASPAVDVAVASEPFFRGRRGARDVLRWAGPAWRNLRQTDR